MHRHEFYTMDDFTPEEIQRENKLAMAVIRYDRKICKVCGYEQVRMLFVDGSHLARRNFHSQRLSTSSGVETGLIYGFINSLLSTQRELRADRIIVAWDAQGGSDWRKDILPSYKGNRTSADPEFYSQLSLLKDFLNAIGITQAESPKAEADDIIGWLTKKEFVDNENFILSGDKDFLSLVDSHTTVINAKGERFFPAEDGTVTFTDTKKSVTLRPEQVVDYKCLVGDSADNISGAVGFGPAAAVKFFENNDGIQNLLDGTVNLKGIPSRAQQGLLAVIPFLEKFRAIVTIDIARGEVSLLQPTVDKDVAHALLKYFEFNQFLAMGDNFYSALGV